jgi:hypothetical protein
MIVDACARLLPWPDLLTELTPYCRLIQVGGVDRGLDVAVIDN